MLCTSDFVLRRPLPTLQPSSITGHLCLLPIPSLLLLVLVCIRSLCMWSFPSIPKHPVHSTKASSCGSTLQGLLVVVSNAWLLSHLVDMQTPKSANIQCSPLAESALTDLVCVKERMPQRIQRTNAFLRLQRQHPLQQIQRCSVCLRTDETPIDLHCRERSGQFQVTEKAAS